MHIKNIHETIEKLAQYSKEMIDCGVGSGKVNVCESEKVICMLKELAEAEYYSLIAKAMKESEEEEKEYEKSLLKMLKEEYGMNADEGKRWYNANRYRNGRYAPKGSGMRMGFEELPYTHMMPMHEWPDMEGRDMDLNVGRMSTGVKPTIYGYAHDEYMVSKKWQDERVKMNKLNKYLREIEEMGKETVAGMSPEEKQNWKVTLNKLINL